MRQYMYKRCKMNIFKLNIKEIDKIMDKMLDSMTDDELLEKLIINGLEVQKYEYFSNKYYDYSNFISYTFIHNNDTSHSEEKDKVYLLKEAV